MGFFVWSVMAVYPTLFALAIATIGFFFFGFPWWSFIIAVAFAFVFGPFFLRLLDKVDRIIANRRKSN